MNYMLSFVLLTAITLSFMSYQTYSICMDFHDPMDLSKSSIVDCSLKQNDNVLDDNFQLNDNDDLFQVKFDCQINDQEICAKVENSFKTAGDIITTSLVLHTPIIVEALFSQMDPNVLGAAATTRLISITDDDNKERFYPQALVKQMQLTSQMAGYADSDIKAHFNSLQDWYFPDDTGSIKEGQHELLYTVLHELIHGLGFLSSWKNHIDLQLQTTTRGLTPFVVTGSNVPPGLPDGSFEFTGFYETIFDKFIVMNHDDDRDDLSTLTDELNQFSGRNKQFTQLSSFYNELQNSSQFDAAKEALSLSTIRNSLIFLPKGSTNIRDDGLILETSLNTFIPGTSIVHADLATYSTDSDFLMTYTGLKGVPMNEIIRKSGNRTGNAIGPKLLGVLNSIGYTIANNPIKPNPKD
ncbi:10279_t:CDS:2 [Funneliformis caledonium]|uniref:10279_t:CDS:1 n=1 Tax=Funneliformis caledonium TaxID=1117310 RepID=A0A9N8ZYZ5_9GLOM|nr:10279_t:CDS:2 [Funneliformis caledonium]